MRTPLLVLALSSCACLAFFTGCRPDETESDDGCECIADESHANPPSAPAQPTCGDRLCQGVLATCDGDCESPLVVSNPEAVTCALTFLLNRTPGTVGWTITQNQGQFQENGYLFIHADGTAVRRTYGLQDRTHVIDDAVLGTLPSMEHFDECLASSDEQARFDCVRGELLSPTAVCDMGWERDAS